MCAAFPSPLYIYMHQACPLCLSVAAISSMLSLPCLPSPIPHQMLQCLARHRLYGVMPCPPWPRRWEEGLRDELGVLRRPNVKAGALDGYIALTDDSPPRQLGEPPGPWDHCAGGVPNPRGKGLTWVSGWRGGRDGGQEEGGRGAPWGVYHVFGLKKERREDRNMMERTSDHVAVLSLMMKLTAQAMPLMMRLIAESAISEMTRFTCGAMRAWPSICSC